MSKKGAGLFLGTTKIDPSQTVGEIHGLLLKAGAAKIGTAQSGGKIVAMHFSMNTPSGEIPFSLPVNVEPVFAILQKDRKSLDRKDHEAGDRLQAERIAWRMVLRWMQAQVAFIETGMVSVTEVFLPYVGLPGQTTFYKQLEARQFKGLPLLIEG